MGALSHSYVGSTSVLPDKICLFHNWANLLRTTHCISTIAELTYLPRQCKCQDAGLAYSMPLLDHVFNPNLLLSDCHYFLMLTKQSLYRQFHKQKLKKLCVVNLQFCITQTF